MNQEYLFTIITPVKNDLRIKELIKSLKSQPSFRLIEFIISFNGATEEFTNEIILLMDSPNFKFLKLPISSTPTAINTGIKLSSSEKIVIIDSDCILMDDFIQKMYQSSKDKNIVCGQVIFKGINFFSKLTAAHRTIIYSLQNNLFYTPNLCIDKKVFNSCGYFNETLKYGFDTEFSQRVINKGYSFHFAAEAVIQHDCHSNFKNEIKIWFYYGRDRCYRFLLGYFGNKSFKNFLKMLYQPLTFSIKESFSYNIYVCFYLIIRNLGALSYLIIK